MNDELKPILDDMMKLRIRFQNLKAWDRNDEELWLLMKSVNLKMNDLEESLLILWKEYF